MVLVDSCVWIGHFRQADKTLQRLWEERLVVSHEYVVGELLCGRPGQGDAGIDAFEDLLWLPRFEHPEYKSLAATQGLREQGLDYVDIHLLGAALISPGVTLMPYDKRLRSTYERIALH